jgi:hypothetical protein
MAFAGNSASRIRDANYYTNVRNRLFLTAVTSRASTASGEAPEEDPAKLAPGDLKGVFPNLD